MLLNKDLLSYHNKNAIKTIKNKIFLNKFTFAFAKGTKDIIINI